MAKQQNKTVSTDASVNTFVERIKDKTRRDEVRKVMAVLRRATKSKPKMWGSSIIGFGSYHFKYTTGREGDWFLTGLSPRKGNLTIYILPGLHLHAENLQALGKFTTGKSCIYVKSLDDIHLPTLEKMARQAVADIKDEIESRTSSSG